MIRMADGPVANIPSGFNAPGFAVAGYVNRSGIGVTFPADAEEELLQQHANTYAGMKLLRAVWQEPVLGGGTWK